MKIYPRGKIPLETNSTLYAVIMAGGSGTRFWPRSRSDRPKQFLAIGTEKPLIVETIQRLSPMIGARNIRIVAGPEHAETIRSLVPQLPEKSLIIEPCPRNTAPCIGLAALHIAQENPDGIMAVLPADHHIADAERFGELVRHATRAADAGHIVTLGIVPTRPETGYGYIEMAESTQGRQKTGPVPVARFVEKPNAPTAQAYCDSGRFLWNSGMFFFSCKTILDAIHVHLPGLHGALSRLRQHLGQSSYQNVLRDEFSTLDSVSIDYGIMEPVSVGGRPAKVHVIPADMGWNDVGHWSALHDFADQDENGNVVSGDCVTFGCSHSVLQADSGTIAAIGLENMIVVKDGDTVLVCPREHAQNVRDIVNHLKKNGRNDLV